MYKTIDICTKLWYFVVVNKTVESEIAREKAIQKICDFFRLEQPLQLSNSMQVAIKELCAIRLCKAIGLNKNNAFKSDFFDFFGCLMGEAVCQKLSIKQRIATDELRLVKYDKINLVQEIKSYLDNETIEEAFLDAFELVDRFKYIIPYLKKSG